MILNQSIIKFNKDFCYNVEFSNKLIFANAQVAREGLMFKRKTQLVECNRRKMNGELMAFAYIQYIYLQYTENANDSATHWSW